VSHPLLTSQNLHRGVSQVVDVQCVTLRRHIQYEPGAHDRGPDAVWDCELLDSSGQILTLDGLDDLDTPEIVEEFESGVSKITIPGGIIDETSIFIPPTARIEIDNSKSRRKLGAKNHDSAEKYWEGQSHNSTENFWENQTRRLFEGTRRVLVVRVIDQKGVSPSSSPYEMREKIFGSRGPNLVTQYSACSFGKLRFVPTTALNGNDPLLTTTGVYEVKLPVSVAGMSEALARSHVTRKLREEFAATGLPNGYDNHQTDVSSPFDHVMYCLPPGTSGSWIASGFENSWLSTFNDKWCTRLSAQMHETGHNLNLEHSGDSFSTTSLGKE